MDKNCVICGKKTGIMSGKIKLLNNALLCNNCAKKTGINTDAKGISILGNMTAEQVKESIEQLSENSEDFKPTLKFDSYVWFDDNNKILKAKCSSIGLKPKTIVPYSAIRDIRIVEDGESITKSGAGAAVGGALLFGPAGAIIGGLHSRGKKKKDIVETLHIILILNNGDNKTIHFISSKTKKKSLIYKNAYKNFLGVGAELERVIEENKIQSKQVVTENRISSIKEELIDLKELLDAGIITQEEFDRKKLEILR